ncbi:hypothetical protein M422DRAFT_780706 [Sphaerobolus stellatus SS14]|uniref:Uncharacterized protein n=1 Tax=Sphaerobolus stellatus (strain SS14) TaxID=990650 RepID=A0A0C9UZY0_SPHS4|nr:hypothetical protein M422DRAFT_780706 [Sphaerobolus stellatus SS14]
MPWWSLRKATVDRRHIRHISNTVNRVGGRGTPELSHLPKAPEIRSLRFRNVAPGRVGNLFLFQRATDPVDKTHPWAKVLFRTFGKQIPQVSLPQFNLACYPFALMERFDDINYMRQARQRGISQEFDEALLQYTSGLKTLAPQATLPSPGDSRRKKYTLPISAAISVPKTLHKSAVLRNKLKSRIREALRMVVVLGAKVSGEKEDAVEITTAEGISLESKDDALVVQGWVYVFRPTLELLRCPWPTLIKQMRIGLENVRKTAIALEAIQRQTTSLKQSPESYPSGGVNKFKQPTFKPMDKLKSKPSTEIASQTGKSPLPLHRPTYSASTTRHNQQQSEGSAVSKCGGKTRERSTDKSKLSTESGHQTGKSQLPSYQATHSPTMTRQNRHQPEGSVFGGMIRDSLKEESKSSTESKKSRLPSHQPTYSATMTRLSRQKPGGPVVEAYTSGGLTRDRSTYKSKSSTASCQIEGSRPPSHQATSSTTTTRLERRKQLEGSTSEAYISNETTRDNSKQSPGEFRKQNSRENRLSRSPRISPRSGEGH